MGTEKSWDQLVSAPWEEKYIQLSTGIGMSYMQAGFRFESGRDADEALPVVLIHGATDSRASWVQIVPGLLEKGYCVYVPELRGHGKSGWLRSDEGPWDISLLAEDISAFLSVLGLKKVHLVGHSIGSFIVQKLAAEYPMLVKTATLISTGYTKTDAVLQFGKDLHSFGDAFPEDFLQLWTACGNEDRDFAKAIYLHAKQLPMGVWLRIFNDSDRENPYACRISCPVQLIWGEKDEFFDRDQQNLLMDALSSVPEKRLLTVPGVGHNVHWESLRTAQFVKDAILEWISDEK